MALTRGTTLPIIPTDLGSGGTQTSARLMTFPCKASEVYRVGDIVVLASGVADAVDTQQADGAIIGVAVEAKTATAAVATSNQVLLSMALPGVFFQGSMTGGAATDYTPSATAATAAADIVGTTTDTVLGTDTYSAFLLINQADTTGGQIRLVRFALAQMGGQTWTLGSQTILNPRVDFVFRCSLFQPLA